MFSSSTAASNFGLAYLEFKIAILDMPTFTDEVQNPERITDIGDEPLSHKFAIEIPELPVVSPVNWGVIASSTLVAGGATAAGVCFLLGVGRIEEISTPSVAELSSATAPILSSLKVFQATAPIRTATHNPTQVVARSTIPEVVPHLITVIVKTAAKLRSAPNQSASIVRTAKAGEKFRLFGKSNGWIQIGTDKPLGWILGSLISDAR